MCFHTLSEFQYYVKYVTSIQGQMEEFKSVSPIDDITEDEQNYSISNVSLRRSSQLVNSKQIVTEREYDASQIELLAGMNHDKILDEVNGRKSMGKKLTFGVSPILQNSESSDSNSNHMQKIDENDEESSSSSFEDLASPLLTLDRGTKRFSMKANLKAVEEEFQDLNVHAFRDKTSSSRSKTYSNHAKSAPTHNSPLRKRFKTTTKASNSDNIVNQYSIGNHQPIEEDTKTQPLTNVFSRSAQFNISLENSTHEDTHYVLPDFEKMQNYTFYFPKGNPDVIIKSLEEFKNMKRQLSKYSFDFRVMRLGEKFTKYMTKSQVVGNRKKIMS